MEFVVSFSRINVYTFLSFALQVCKTEKTPIKCQRDNQNVILRKIWKLKKRSCSIILGETTILNKHGIVSNTR